MLLSGQTHTAYFSPLVALALFQSGKLKNFREQWLKSVAEMPLRARARNVRDLRGTLRGLALWTRFGV